MWGCCSGWLECWQHRNVKQLCTEKEVVRHAQLEVCVDFGLGRRLAEQTIDDWNGSHSRVTLAVAQRRSEAASESVRQRLNATHWFVVHGLVWECNRVAMIGSPSRLDRGTEFREESRLVNHATHHDTILVGSRAHHVEPSLLGVHGRNAQSWRLDDEDTIES